MHAQRGEGLSVWALAPYRRQSQLSPTAELLHRLKYAEQTCSAASLGWALAYHWPAALESSVVVPVPLHPERLVERGYNQSALLARAVARYRRPPVKWEDSVLHRCVGGPPQAQLDRDDRLRNLHGSFRAKDNPPGTSRPAVVLLDDVVTTGATLSACQKAMTDAGFDVQGAVCCALAF